MISSDSSPILRYLPDIADVLVANSILQSVSSDALKNPQPLRVFFFIHSMCQSFCDVNIQFSQKRLCLVFHFYNFCWQVIIHSVYMEYIPFTLLVTQSVVNDNTQSSFPLFLVDVWIIVSALVSIHIISFTKVLYIIILLLSSHNRFFSFAICDVNSKMWDFKKWEIVKTFCHSRCLPRDASIENQRWTYNRSDWLERYW